MIRRRRRRRNEETKRKKRRRKQRWICIRTEIRLWRWYGTSRSVRRAWGTKHWQRKQVTNLRESKVREEVREQRWQEKLVTERERDEELGAERCFWWLSDWRTCPTHIIAGMFELYEQLYPHGCTLSIRHVWAIVVIGHVGCVVQRQRAWPTSYLPALRLPKPSTLQDMTTSWRSCSSRSSLTWAW